MLPQSAMNEPTVVNLESMKGDYNGPIIGPSTEKIDFFLDITRYEVAMRTFFVLHPHAQLRVKVVTKIFGLIQTKSKDFL